jgi:hypothetical protein
MTKSVTDRELCRSADQFAWRRFWLASVMSERFQPLPPKVARLKARATNRNLTGRLYHLRRLEWSEGPSQSGSN